MKFKEYAEKRKEEDKRIMLDQARALANAVNELMAAQQGISFEAALDAITESLNNREAKKEAIRRAEKQAERQAEEKATKRINRRVEREAEKAELKAINWAARE